MTKNTLKPILLLLVLLLPVTFRMYAQNPYTVTGVVKEAISNSPLESVLVSIAGENARTNEKGEFEISVTDPDAYMVVQTPGYTTRLLKLNKQTRFSIAMVSTSVKSVDDQIPAPLGNVSIRNMTQAGSYIFPNDINQKANSSLDQVMQGKLIGTQVTMGSGMPGSKSFINIRGLSSLYGRNEPLVMIDEMIHPIHYANFSAIDGFTINPLDIVDVDDVESVSVFNDGNSYLGSWGSNGVIYINLEQKRETSSSIIVNAYGGISFSPKRQSLLDAQGFKSLLNEQISQSGMSENEINSRFSFLNAAENTEDYHRYNNNTDWQNEIYRVGVVQKYHIFLKGGDDIATYNISTGYLSHEGILANTRYDRFNLRVNGKINITDKFSVLPNTKVSLSDSYLMEQGYNISTNPILAAQFKSPLMAPMKIDADGKELEFIDDIGAFNVSNPSAIVNNLEATNRNYHFITSVKGKYVFNRNLNISTLVGIDFNNSRDNIFIPDVGLSRIDSAYNSSRALVNEYRSTQNQNQLNYSNSFDSRNNLDVKIGHRYVENSYEYDKASDLNSTTDDFKSLGQGASNQELRTISGESRVVKWVSYYATADYNYADKYYVSVALSYDANSMLNKNARYNFYPSVSAAWRVSSESFLAGKTWLDDLKIRASYSQTGNLNNFAYDYSHLYYQGLKQDNISVVVRESVPNPEMEMEKQTTLNVGADMVLLGQKMNLSLNLFNSTVDNLVTRQRIAPAYGYTSYYNNAGSLRNMGAELQFNYRQKLGALTWNVGGNFSFIDNQVTSLDFILEGEDKIVHEVEGVNLVTKAGEPLYSYFGFKTDGIFNDDAEAAQYIGPNGQKGKAGDIRYVDQDGNKVINDLDKTIIGSPIAPIFGGIYTSFGLGNFEIKADFSFSSGNDMYNHINKSGQSMELGYNQQSIVNNRWTPENTNTNIPGISVGDPYGNNAFSDRWLEKGDYARLSSLTVSYKYPSTNKLFGNLTLYLTATNVFTLTSYSGLDPESMLYNDPLYLSNDYGKMPQPKLVVIGVKLGL
ncbi:MAG TPA: SusC/RagA family TonB-linked outer membrane protein [Prolixibacteraceae bacterium]|nr:SusC/RagA family TonB-linked outer membrane protein [Prolixibacteraceae bacterium]